VAVPRENSYIESFPQGVFSRIVRVGNNGQPALSVPELERLLKSVDPAVLLVPPRILRRMLRSCGTSAPVGFYVPHRKSFVCTAERLLAVAEPQELGLERGRPLPEAIILLPRPEPQALAGRYRGDVLVKYWRLLFHAAVHRTLESAPARLDAAAVGDRVRALGLAEFDEIRQVLRQERYLAGADGDRAVYVEFAAVILEYRYFARGLLPLYFPSLGDLGRVERLLAADLDAGRLFAETRLPGAPDPQPEPSPDAAPKPDQEWPEPDQEWPEPVETGSARLTGDKPRLLRRAAQAARAGNQVRAALLKVRASLLANTGGAKALRSGARADIDALVQRLQAALQLGPEERAAWRPLLTPLLEPAARGVWSREARFLYDLQKVCIAAERPVFAVDLVEWALSLGRRPVKRPLPYQPDVLGLKYLRSALRRLPSLQVTAGDRRRLAQLLEAAARRVEERLREKLRPVLRKAVEAVALRPRNFPERVAQEKLIEELLDQAAGRGFLTMGDLRDAIARNQLKMPDLSGSLELLGGDPLIRLNRRLAVAVDGVYHRGEIYLRWLQRLSSACFGTAAGRLLTRYVTLPFGGAFFALYGTQLMIEEVVKLFADEGAAQLTLLNRYSFACVGLFLFALLHVAPFRRLVGQAAAALGAGLRWSLITLPAAVLGLPLVQGFLDSRPFLWARQYLLKPLTVALPLSAALPLAGAGWVGWSVGLTALTAATSALWNSRWGREWEEIGQDWLARCWRQIHLDLVPGLFWFVVGLFRRAVELMERGLYSVDEWLRFRAGDSRLSLVVKPALGVVWFFLTYVIRIFINLFVEPTFNPINHFPVVTVAAKILLPALPQMSKAVLQALAPVLGKALAGSVAGLGVFFLPGLAGFLVWEFKENWRLYRANRPKHLWPVLVGHHGETLPRLLRPGFHSGTLPKVFAKLRKARRRAERTGRWRTYRKQRTALHHVESAVRHFLGRELLLLVNDSARWTTGPVSLSAVELGTNQIRARLLYPTLGPLEVHISFWEHARRLTARVDEPGWLNEVAPEQRALFAAALAGTFRLSGVDGEPAAIAWEEWVAAWERFQAGKMTPAAFAAGVLP
jgi:hypothetical protein